LNRDRLFLFFDGLTQFGLGGLIFFLPISNALIATFAGFTVLGFVGKKIIRPDFESFKNKQNIFLVIFFFFMGLSLVNSGLYFYKGLVSLLLKWGKYIVLSLIFQDTVKTRKQVIVFVGVFIFSAILTAFSGISQLYLGAEFLRGREVLLMKNGIHAITSSFPHCNGFGAYLVIPFVLCIACLKTKNLFRSGAGYLLLFLILIFAFCVFHTYSRGTWVSVFAALIIMLLISRRFIILIPLLVFCGVLLFIPEFRKIFLSIFDFNADADRFKYWQVAISMFKENPLLGQGLGSFMSRFSGYLPETNISYAHNCFLQILAESGIFSLLAFLGFIFIVLQKGIRRFILSRDPLLLGAVSGLIGFLVHSFFEVNLYSLPLATLFWLWVGLVSVLSLPDLALEK